MRKTRLKPMSKEKEGWNRKYREAWGQDTPMQKCAKTGAVMPKGQLERHHVARRSGNRILIYCYVVPEFHRWVEDHTKEALELGWLRREAMGYQHDPKQPRPWIPGTLKNEHLLGGRKKPLKKDVDFR